MSFFIQSNKDTKNIKNSRMGLQSLKYTKDPIKYPKTMNLEECIYFFHLLWIGDSEKAP